MNLNAGKTVTVKTFNNNLIQIAFSRMNGAKGNNSFVFTAEFMKPAVQLTAQPGFVSVGKGRAFFHASFLQQIKKLIRSGRKNDSPTVLFPEKSVNGFHHFFWEKVDMTVYYPEDLCSPLFMSNSYLINNYTSGRFLAL